LSDGSTGCCGRDADGTIDAQSCVASVSDVASLTHALGPAKIPFFSDETIPVSVQDNRETEIFPNFPLLRPLLNDATSMSFPDWLVPGAMFHRECIASQYDKTTHKPALASWENPTFAYNNIGHSLITRGRGANSNKVYFDSAVLGTAFKTDRLQGEYIQSIFMPNMLLAEDRKSFASAPGYDTWLTLRGYDKSANYFWGNPWDPSDTGFWLADGGQYNYEVLVFEHGTSNCIPGRSFKFCSFGRWGDVNNPSTESPPLSGGNREVVPQDPTGIQTWEIDMAPNARYEAYVVCKWEPIGVTSGLNRFLISQQLDMERHFAITKYNAPAID